MTALAIRLGLAAAAAALCGTGAFAAPLGLAAHRAIYDLSLDDTRGNSVANVSGRLVMEFTGSRCSGYSTKLRFVTQTETSDGDRQVTDSRSSTFETADGKSLEFTNETYTDDTLAEESRGKANRSAADVAVDLLKPSTKKFDLSRPVSFPTEQMEKLIDSALKGEKFVSMNVYDGSEDGETIFATAGVIGKESQADNDLGEETAVAGAGIAGLRHWPLTISYFNTKQGGDETPFYVMSFVVYENGVGRSLKIDYGDFALTGRLTRLDMLPTTPCP
jgi:hypothetical protein